jgi:hypothetical protein
MARDLSSATGPEVLQVERLDAEGSVQSPDFPPNVHTPEPLSFRSLAVDREGGLLGIQDGLYRSRLAFGQKAGFREIDFFEEVRSGA